MNMNQAVAKILERFRRVRSGEAQDAAGTYYADEKGALASVQVPVEDLAALEEAYSDEQCSGLPEVFGLQEAAKFLDVSYKTMRNMLLNSKVPHFRPNGRGKFKFHRPLFLNWIKEQHNSHHGVRR